MAMTRQTIAAAASLCRDVDLFKKVAVSRVTWTGTGIYLATDTPTPEQVRDAVDQIVAESEYRACAQKLAQESASCHVAKSLTELGGRGSCRAGSAHRVTQI
jgi:hypothetical protein